MSHYCCLCRNLPFDCGEEDISDAFAEFGDIVYCKQVINQETDIPKGTYVCVCDLHMAVYVCMCIYAV